MYIPYKNSFESQRSLIEHTESRMIHTYVHIYVKKILNQLPSVELAELRPNYMYCKCTCTCIYLL